MWTYSTSVFNTPKHTSKLALAIIKRRSILMLSENPDISNYMLKMYQLT